MKRSAIGELVFWSATAFALLLYWLTSPAGLPWNASSDLAMSSAFVTDAAVTLPHPFWRYFVAMAEGHFVFLSCLAAAVSAGLIAAMVNRYFDWRLGVAAALVWIFLPGVWNRAITGECGVCLAAAVVIASWTLNAVALRVFRKARKAVKSESAGAPLAAHGGEAKRGKVNRIASWSVLGAAGLFAVVSATTLHSYRYGEAASAYARLIVEEAGDRIILLNGLCDEQVVDAAARRVRKVGEDSILTRQAATSTISFRFADANRSNLVAWVRREWPAETNLWIAAQVSPSAFADAAVKAHPDRFYAMRGQSTTLEGWEVRWEAMKPYLASGDKFIPAMRRMFAYEGNLLGNGLQEKGDLKAAWRLYLRVFDEIEPHNPAACENLNGMLAHGYKVDSGTRSRIESAKADYMKLLKDKRKARRVMARIAASGPVMRDQKAYDELRERVKKQMEELEKKGEKIEPPEELKTLTDWLNDMMKAFYASDMRKSVRIARAILSRRQWRGFIPAHAIMGEAMLRQGDLVAADAFFRVAMEGTGPSAPPTFLYNDYAETLRRLKRYDEAEKYARKAVEGTETKNGWLFKMTLAQILRDRANAQRMTGEIDEASLAAFAVDATACRVRKEGENSTLTRQDAASANVDAEIKQLVREALKYAPEKARERIRKEFPR